MDIHKKQKLFGKLSKCVFAASEVEYLGHLLRRDGISVDPGKVEAIESWPQPRKKTEVQSFLGLVNYHRRFIRNCSTIAKPLIALTSNAPFNWSGLAQKSFLNVKKALCSAPVLRCFDPKIPIAVTTDASQYAIGAVLEQGRGKHRTSSLRFKNTERSRTKLCSRRTRTPGSCSRSKVVDIISSRPRVRRAHRSLSPAIPGISRTAFS